MKHGLPWLGIAVLALLFRWPEGAIVACAAASIHARMP